MRKPRFVPRAAVGVIEARMWERLLEDLPRRLAPMLRRQQELRDEGRAAEAQMLWRFAVRTVLNEIRGAAADELRGHEVEGSA